MSLTFIINKTGVFKKYQDWSFIKTEMNYE